jgi:hypothetical protein
MSTKKMHEEDQGGFDVKNAWSQEKYASRQMLGDEY